MIILKKSFFESEYFGHQERESGVLFIRLISILILLYTAITCRSIYFLKVQRLHNYLSK